MFEATYWQYNSSLLSTRSNPDSFAAFVQDFGSGSGSSSTSTTSTRGPAPRPPRAQHHHHDLVIVGVQLLLGIGCQRFESLGRADLPGTGQGGSTVTIQNPSGDVSTGGGPLLGVVAWVVPESAPRVRPPGIRAAPAADSLSLG